MLINIKKKKTKKKLEKLNHTKPEETRKFSMRELNLALKQLSRGN